jgi:hypothetical protein
MSATVKNYENRCGVAVFLCFLCLTYVPGRQYRGQMCAISNGCATASVLCLLPMTFWAACVILIGYAKGIAYCGICLEHIWNVVLSGSEFGCLRMSVYRVLLHEAVCAVSVILTSSQNVIVLYVVLYAYISS